MASGSVRPAWWGKLVQTPHREDLPRTQCVSCAGGGSINDVPCRDCGQRGYFDAQHPPRTGKAATADDDAY